jgi:hypothetical protein
MAAIGPTPSAAITGATTAVNVSQTASGRKHAT